MLEYYKEILYYIQRMVGDKEEAKDVTQEAYIRVLEIDSKSQISNKRAYLYKIARNLVIDGSKKKHKNFEVTYEEDSYSIPKEEQPEEIITTLDEQELLMKTIQTLPAKSKQAFVLHIINGYTRKEISEKMGISTNAVEKHITRATSKIKQKIQEK